MEGKLTKYIFTVATLLDYKSKIRKHYSPDTVISKLFDENLDEIDFIKSLSELELIQGFEITDELYDKTNLTLEEFADELFQLLLSPADQYEEFFDIKFTSMKLTKRYIELENKTDAKSILEMQKINEEFQELDVRLNVLVN